jgi:hypothetical protein
MHIFARRCFLTRLQVLPVFSAPGCLRLSGLLRIHQQISPFSSLRPRSLLHDAELQHEAATRLHWAEEARRPISQRPLIVAAGICIGAFIAAEYLDGRDSAKIYATLQQPNSGWTGGDTGSALQFVAEKRMKETLQWLDQFHAPAVVKVIYYQSGQWWMQLHGGNDAIHATMILIAANAAVFLAFNLASRSPRLMIRMSRSFLHYPGHSAPYTLLTAVFAHRVSNRIPL